MEKIKKRLQELYLQKESIQKEINSLESQLNIVKSFTKDEKIKIFKKLFVGNSDVFAKKWENKDKSTQQFFPVTKTFKGEDYIHLDNENIELHLRGKIQLATYPILYKNLTKYLVLQISKQSINSLQNVLIALNLSGYYEVNEKNNINVWIFFEELIYAKLAKSLGYKILKESNVNGKIYPNQDFSNRSSLGNYLELPLHLKHRNNNKTVFIDIKTNQPINDQWTYLSKVNKAKKKQIEQLVNTEDILQTPWKRKKDDNNLELPKQTLEIVLYDKVYIKNEFLSKSFTSLLKDLASFENPQVKLLLSLRKPLYNIPKVIRNFEENEQYLILPRGLFENIKILFKKYEIQYSIEDKRIFNKEEFGTIIFTLRDEQQIVVNNILKSDYSICVAPPGFGKTLIGAKIVEQRSCSTLVVVNKNMLLNQWIQRFVDYFEMSKKSIGFLGKGKNTLNGKLDIATMQSLKNTPEIIENYSQVIVDECHHIPAVTFELIIKQFKGKYILGLSATPNRKDGLQPILFQQLGNISYEHKKKRTIVNELEVIKTNFESRADNYSQIISELSVDKNRNSLIVDEVVKHKDRKILILTDRLEHISELENILNQKAIDYVSVHGGLNKKDQTNNMKLVYEKSLILATTSFFGEGIDFPHLNTIIFATPISYYGRLIQYLGRIGRDGQKCLAIDFLDSKNAMLYSAFKKRKEGYKQMHYKYSLRNNI